MTVGAARSAGCALFFAIACATKPLARPIEAPAEATRQLAWLEQPVPADTLPSSSATNALNADPLAPPASSVSVDDAGADPRRALVYALDTARVERLVVTLTAEIGGVKSLVPVRPYQVASFVAHVLVSSRAVGLRAGHGAWHTWEVRSVEGEAPRGIPDQLELGFDQLGTPHRGMRREHPPHDERAALVLYGVSHCLRALAQPLPGDPVGEGASWHGESEVAEWGLPGKRKVRYRLRSLGEGRASIVASGETIAERPGKAAPSELAENESYDLRERATFTREAEVVLESPIAEGRQTELILVSGVQKTAGKLVPFDARATLECRVRRE